MLVQLPDDLALGSASPRGVLDGANLMAIGDGETEWELFQYAEAEPVAPGVWRLRKLLRGLFGTDAVIVPPVWPQGSQVVRIDDAVRQIDLPLNLRKIDRHYRIGPASRAPDDPVYVSRIEAFRGNGLRPYAPAHLRARRLPSGAVAVNWIRRTRIDGDDWDLFRRAAGRRDEGYLLRVESGGQIRREVEVSARLDLFGLRTRPPMGPRAPSLSLSRRCRNVSGRVPSPATGQRRFAPDSADTVLETAAVSLSMAERNRRPAMPEAHQKLAKLDPVWARICDEAREAVADEPLIGGVLHNSLLHHKTMERALAYRFSLKLASPELSEQILREIAEEAYGAMPWLGEAARADLVAVFDRDPACTASCSRSCSSRATRRCRPIASGTGSGSSAGAIWPISCRCASPRCSASTFTPPRGSARAS
jgi:hypothetical protein